MVRTLGTKNVGVQYQFGLLLSYFVGLIFQILLLLLCRKQSSYPDYTFQDPVFVLFTPPP